MSVDTRNKLAVALHYDKTGAPRVVAKGKGTIGAKIVELARAELQPGEIVIRDGTPPQAAPAKAGHFLDRAL